MSMNSGLYSSNTDEWATPLALFKDLDDEFHFDLDICASDLNFKCSKYFTKEFDALSHQDLWNGNLWCNPPYGREISKWVESCSKYNRGLCVMLLPARTDTKWFHDFIYHNDHATIRFLKGRLHFNDSKNSAPFPSMLVIFNNDISL